MLLLLLPLVAAVYFWGFLTAGIFTPSHGLLRIASTALIAALYFCLGIVYFVRANPFLYVNRNTKMIRVRRRTHPYVDITRATVLLDASTHKPTLVLVLRTVRHLSAKVILRTEDDVALPDDWRAALLEVIAGSSITVPTTPDDPRGKFTHVNFPGRLSQSDALTLVELNPTVDEQIPGLPRWH